MSNKIDELSKKARGSGVFGVVSILLGAVGLWLSYGYSSEADRVIESERANNPEYQTLLRKREEQERIDREKDRADQQQRYLANSAVREKELEAQKERYIYEQEKLKVDQENKRISDIQAMNTDAMALLDKYETPSELDDYGLIDAAYEIMDILKQEGITEQVKYRGLKRISEFKGYTDKRSTDEKLDGIIAKIERM